MSRGLAFGAATCGSAIFPRVKNIDYESINNKCFLIIGPCGRFHKSLLQSIQLLKNGNGNSLAVFDGVFPLDGLLLDVKYPLSFADARYKIAVDYVTRQ